MKRKPLKSDFVGSTLISKKILLFLLTLSVSLVSCRKSPKDFLGTYDTFYATQITLTNNITYLTGKYDPNKTNASEYLDLSPIQLKLFLKEPDKTIVGEGSIDFLKVDNASIVHHVVSDRMDFNLIDFQINNDTLEFTFENELIKRLGKKFHGKLMQVGEEAIMALGSGIVDENWIEKNPFVKNKKQNFTYFRANLKNEDRVILMRSFWETQGKGLEASISKLSRVVEKNKAENSLKVIHTRIEKLQLKGQ